MDRTDSQIVCECVFVRVRARFFLRRWLSCVIEDIHTSASTHFLSNCEQAELKCVCVCVFDVWFLKQRAALELLRASERNIWCWNMVSHLIDNKYQEMRGEEESGHTVVKVRVSQGEQVKDSSAVSRGWGSEWEMGCQLEVTLRSWKSAGQQGEGHKQAFSCLSGTLKLQYVLFYILQFHFFFLWLKIDRWYSDGRIFPPSQWKHWGRGKPPLLCTSPHLHPARSDFFHLSNIYAFSLNTFHSSFHFEELFIKSGVIYS